MLTFVLNSEQKTLLFRHQRESFEKKSATVVCVAMLCFTCSSLEITKLAVDPSFTAILICSSMSHSAHGLESKLCIGPTGLLLQKFMWHIRIDRSLKSA